MQIIFEQGDRSSHEYPDQYLYLRLSWKDYRLCTKQFLPQNYNRKFSQFREMGWLLEDALKSSVVEIIYSEALRTGKPVFCIVDDTIASKTNPSSQALHPIEDAYFHQSHLKGIQAPGDISLSRKDTNWFSVPFNRKSISICFSIQNSALILKHLWN